MIMEQVLQEFQKYISSFFPHICKIRGATILAKNTYFITLHCDGKPYFWKYFIT